LRQYLGSVGNPGGLLKLGSRGRNLSAGQRGVAARLVVALEDHHAGASLVGGQRRGAAASPGADDEHRHRHRKTFVLDPKNRHVPLLPAPVDTVSHAR
jgi:hypothetical protein